MLVDERNKWRESFDQGEFFSVYLSKYKEVRDTDNQRMPAALEYLCEYILHLEDKIDENSFRLRS